MALTEMDYDAKEADHEGEYFDTMTISLLKRIMLLISFSSKDTTSFFLFPNFRTATADLSNASNSTCP